MKFITPMVATFACAVATSAFAAQATFYQLPPGDNPHDVARMRKFHSGQARLPMA